MSKRIKVKNERNFKFYKVSYLKYQYDVNFSSDDPQEREWISKNVLLFIQLNFQNMALR